MDPTNAPGSIDGQDPFGLLGQKEVLRVEFGDVELGPASSGGSFTTSLNKIPTARVKVDLTYAPPGPIDYASPISLGFDRQGTIQRTFTGVAVSAAASPRSVEVEASAQPALEDSQIDTFMQAGVPVPEILHVMVRTAGLPETQVSIEGLDDLPGEVFEIVAPVMGVTVSRPVRVAGVTFLPASHGARILDSEAPPELRERFKTADCHALALATGSRMFKAEEEGVSKIDGALAWLTTRARYGLAWLPDGRIQGWDRASRRADLHRADLVAVRGIATRRHWVRTPDVKASEVVLDFEAEPLLGAPHVWTLTGRERQSVLAARRAANTRDPIEAVSAFWEAVEFYVGDLPLPDVYTKAQRTELRQAIPDSLPDDVKRRARNVLDRLNQRPLLEKLRWRTTEDGVPMSEGEWQLLSDLRKVRNQVVHGSGRADVTSEQVELAVSLLARFLLYRQARSRTREAGPTL